MNTKRLNGISLNGLAGGLEGEMRQEGRSRAGQIDPSSQE